jgi:hypothetical protein
MYEFNQNTDPSCPEHLNQLLKSSLGIQQRGMGIFHYENTISCHYEQQ